MQAAKDGNLTFMVGGREAAYEEAVTLLSNMGKNVVHCGEVGTGEVSGLGREGTNISII